MSDLPLINFNSLNSFYHWLKNGTFTKYEIIAAEMKKPVTSAAVPDNDYLEVLLAILTFRLSS